MPLQIPSTPGATGAAPAAGRFGDGPLSRIAAAVYTLLVVQALFVLAVAPGLVLLSLLARDDSNLPLVAVAVAPVGPALSAAIWALHRPLDPTDLHPAAAFRHGYRLGALPVLRLWLPALALLSVVGINLTHLDVAGVPRSFAVPLTAIAAGTVLWAADALVIATVFDFRTRDAARLAGYFLLRAPGVTVGVALLGAACAAVVYAASEAALAGVGALVGLSLLRTCRPMIVRIEREFVR